MSMVANGGGLWQAWRMTVALRGALVGLRARQPGDVAVLHAELYDDVTTRSRADTRPWRPLPADAAGSPYAVPGATDDAAMFSVIEIVSDDLAGEALLWGIDEHNRLAHVGISLRPGFRGRGLGTDTLRVLCHYGIDLRGFHRLQMETLADNKAMLQSAERVGYVREGTLRHSAWVDGAFVDQVVLGLLAGEWNRGELEPPAIQKARNDDNAG
jgi:RimJ/RimL family protein N-acetyltransferase